MADKIFEDSRLVTIYDYFDGERKDLEHYLAIAKENLTITSDSTLRFREQEEIEHLLRISGFKVKEVRDAPDRPGKEFVFIATPVSN